MPSHIEKLVERFSELKSQQNAIQSFVNAIVTAHKKEGKVLLCGNGGSAADCEHISGELLKGFLLKRQLPPKKIAQLNKALGNEKDALSLQEGVSAIPLVSLMSGLSAYSNDASTTLAFAQMVYSIGRKQDVLVLLSTSGSSTNVVKAAQVAKAMGIKTVALVGNDGGKLVEICDTTIIAPANQTYLVQEYHVSIYHAVCAEVERVLFGN